MSKPIVITKVGRKYTMAVNGANLVMVSGKAVPDSAELSMNRERATWPTKAEAMSFAHMYGRYKLGLGDFVFSYVEVVS